MFNDPYREWFDREEPAPPGFYFVEPPDWEERLEEDDYFAALMDNEPPIEEEYYHRKITMTETKKFLCVWVGPHSGNFNSDDFELKFSPKAGVLVLHKGGGYAGGLFPWSNVEKVTGTPELLEELYSSMARGTNYWIDEDDG